MQQHIPISKKEEKRPKVLVSFELEDGLKWSGMAENIVVDESFPVPYALWNGGPLMPGGDGQWHMEIYGLGNLRTKATEPVPYHKIYNHYADALDLTELDDRQKIAALKAELLFYYRLREDEVDNG